MMAAFHTLAPLAWRNLWRNPRRTVITLIVVSVGMWSVIIFNSFLAAWAQSSKEATLGLLIGQGQIHAPGFLDDPSIDALMPMPAPALQKALASASISAWAARLVLPGVIQSEYKTLPVSVTGVDPASERNLSSLPGKVVQGRYLNGVEDDGVVLGLHLAERLKTGLGRRVILMSQSQSGGLAEQSFDVVGLFDADQQTEDYYAFTGRTAAQKFVGLDDRIAEIAVAIPNDSDLDATMQRLTQAAPDLDVRSWKKLSLFLATTDSFMQSFVYIWLAVVFALMAIGIVNTQLMAVFERTHEFGMLRALGMQARLVLVMVAMESALLIGFGVLLGIGGGMLTIWYFHAGIDLSAFAKGLEMFQGGQVLYPDYDVASTLIFGLIIWGLGVLVALWPARRASKSSPVEAMRHAT